MLRATKTFLNMLFLVFAVLGFAAIGRNELLPEGYAPFLPVALVALYGLLVGRILRECRDRALADHHLDSIYFLGFLFTLVSLAVFFLELQHAVAGDLSGALMGEAFYYVGVSVTTSLGGVLFRNIARGSYLRDHPDESGDLAEMYRALERAAKSFTDGYEETFSRLDLFLRERSESAEELREAELRNRRAVGELAEVTEKVARQLTEAQSTLSGAAGEVTVQVNGFGRAVAELESRARTAAEATAGYRGDLENLPLEAVGAELHRFRTGVDELNLVLDSLLEILNEKVGRLV